MKAHISKSTIRGTIKVPSSKSYTLRALMCAALAAGTSEIFSPLDADDTAAASAVLAKTGVGIIRQAGCWQITGGNLHKPDGELFCGDSAATLRFMTAMCAAIPGNCRLTAGKYLSKRPVGDLVEALRHLGVKISSCNGFPPVEVTGNTLTGGNTVMRGDVSSQYVSALLLAAPLAEKPVNILLTTNLDSRPYVAMTLECMNQFGIEIAAAEDMRLFTVIPQKYRPAKYVIEGDWSSASYFLASGAVLGKITVSNLNPRSLQGDKTLMGFLVSMGAGVDINGYDITVKKEKLQAIKVDMEDCIDLLPTMAVLAALANGTSEFTGIGRARLKESDRVAAMCEGLARMGINVSGEEDRMVIEGSIPRGSVIDSKADHRIAMAFSILGLVTGNTTIEGAECVNKTFPGFWEMLRSVGGEVTIE
jgi:3-phosphoshikimate 1-carboxyvinyltransferase